MVNIDCNIDDSLNPDVMSGVRFLDCNYTLVAILLSDIKTKLELTHRHAVPFWYVNCHPDWGYSEEMRIHSIDWDGKDLTIYFFDNLFMDYDTVIHINKVTNCKSYRMVSISPTKSHYYFSSILSLPLIHMGLEHDLGNLKECKNIINNYLNKIDE